MDVKKNHVARLRDDLRLILVEDALVHVVWNTFCSASQTFCALLLIVDRLALDFVPLALGTCHASAMNGAPEILSTTYKPES